MHILTLISFSGHLSSYHILSAISNSTLNMGAQISLRETDFLFFWSVTTSGVIGSCGIPIFNFLRNFSTVFSNGCDNSHFCKQCTRVPFSPHLSQNMLSSVFLVMAFLTNTRWYFTVVVICIFLMTCNVGHLFMCFGLFYVFFWEVSICVLCLYLIGFFGLVLVWSFCYEVVCIPYIFWIRIDG